MENNEKSDSWIKEFLSNDNKVKAVFDNARNFVVCSAIMYAGIFLYKHPNNPICLSYVSAFILILSGAILAAVNICHAWLKFNQLSLSKLIIVVFALIYGIVAIDLVQSLFVARIIKFNL